LNAGAVPQEGFWFPAGIRLAGSLTAQVYSVSSAVSRIDAPEIQYFVALSSRDAEDGEGTERDKKALAGRR